MRFVPFLSWEPSASLSFQDGGLTAAAGTSSVRLSKTCRIATDDDKGRCLALLSVLCREPVAPEVLAPVEAAAAYWAAGDKALANLRLVFSDLPKLREPADIHRLEAAAWCLDQGLTPGELMRALGLDFDEARLGKYNPAEPRVPKGVEGGGEWTDYAGAGDWRFGSLPTVVRPDSSAATLPTIQIAANGPFVPGGIVINQLPLPGFDPLDPQRLNKPLSLEEQQAVADTVNMIMSGNFLYTRILNPHDYENWPHSSTGAVLPRGFGAYKTYYVRLAGNPPGQRRIIMDEGNAIYYSNNHYKSFYPVDIRSNTSKLGD